MLLEVISGASVIGISVIMYPLFKPYKEKLSRWYLLRVIEGSLMVITGALFLSNSIILLEIRELIWVGHAYVFIAAAFVFYYLLYLSKLIPAWLSGWGIIATILLLIGNLMELVHMTPSMLLYLPIMVNEVVLAVWLMLKGFNQSAVISEPINADM
jgi:hypothetical protein